MVVGYSATLRGPRMYDFLEKLVNVTIPRVRDFQGLEQKLIDQTGICQSGFKNTSLFRNRPRKMSSGFRFGDT